MRLPTLLLLCACGSTPASFQTDYATRSCEVLDEQCRPEQLPELCRSIGIAPLAEPVTACTFDTLTADACLNGAWSCGEDGQVVPPAACARVWTCPEQDG